MKHFTTPLTDSNIASMRVGDTLTISGIIFTGRDAVLPKVVSLIEQGRVYELGIDLRGTVIFHTAVSPAGIGPTSSNKLEIESSFSALSQAGVKMHLGKGQISPHTIEQLRKYQSCYAIIPPITALLESRILERRCVAFPELGMEALHLLRVTEIPVIIAAVGGKTIYTQ